MYSIMFGPSCESCGRQFKNQIELMIHENEKCKNNTCKNCGSTFRRHRDLEKHQKSKKKLVCTCCQRRFCDETHLHKHLRQVWKKKAGELVEYNQPICPPTAYEHYDGYTIILQQHHNDIKTKTVTEQFKVTYNIAMQSYLTDEDMDKKPFTLIPNCIPSSSISTKYLKFFE